MRHDPELDREANALAVDAFEIGLWSADLPAGPLVWNERMCALTGHPTPADPREWLSRFVHAEDQPLVLDAAEHLRAGTFSLGPIRVVTPRHQVVWIRVNGRVHLDPDGRPARVVGSAMDVSEAVLSEQRLARSARFETLGYFSAGVSHNFNNMLMVIEACLEELRTTLDDEGIWSEASERAMTDAHDAARRAAEVVAQLSSLAQPGGADAWAVREVSEICREVGRLVARVFPAEIRFEQALVTKACVKCVPGAIEQVLSNVLLNARDALVTAKTPDPVVSLAVVVADLHGASTVQIFVRDNGPGVPDAVLERVFEPFVTTKGSAGTGLGLASAAAIMERHGGQMIGRNHPQGGAEFLIQLPAAEPAPAPLAGEAKPAPSSTTTGARVLVVDDERPILRVVSKGLSRAGFSVSTASSATEVEAVLEREPAFALVLLDRSLGLTKGESLLPLIRARMPDCKVLSFTGEPLAPSLLARVDGVLYKPVSLKGVAAAVREALDA